MLRLPEWCWNNTLECVVKILKAGRYPDTVVVRLPDDKEVEAYINDLRVHNGNV